MAKWLEVCTHCGHRVEGDLSNGKCPECGAASWLCRLLDLPAVTNRWQVAEPRIAPDNALRGSNTCNKIQASVIRSVGRPRASISIEKVMVLAADGMTLRVIAARVGISHMTVKRILAGQGAR